jgi:hypothetical protein
MRSLFKDYHQLSSSIPDFNQVNLLINFDRAMAAYLQEQVNHPGYIGEMVKVHEESLNNYQSSDEEMEAYEDYYHQ